MRGEEERKSGDVVEGRGGERPVGGEEERDGERRSKKSREENRLECTGT